MNTSLLRNSENSQHIFTKLLFASLVFEKPYESIMYRMLGECVKTWYELAILLQRVKKNPLITMLQNFKGLQPSFTLKPAEMTSHFSLSTPLLIYKQHDLFL